MHFLKQCAKSQFSERGLMPQCGFAMLHSMQAYGNRTAELRMQGFCSTPLGEHPFGNGCNLRPLCKGFRHDTCLSVNPCRTTRTLLKGSGGQRVKGQCAFPIALCKIFIVRTHQASLHVVQVLCRTSARSDVPSFDPFLFPGTAPPSVVPLLLLFPAPL